MGYIAHMDTDHMQVPHKVAADRAVDTAAFADNLGQAVADMEAGMDMYSAKVQPAADTYFVAWGAVVTL